MSRISAENAFRVLAKWSREQASIHVVLSRSMSRRAAGTAIVNKILPHSQKALLTLHDENGEEVGVTVDLAGAEWEYTSADRIGGSADLEDTSAAVPQIADTKGASLLAATFPDGNRYVFEETSEPAE
jgi:hypothetical protein